MLAALVVMLVGAPVAMAGDAPPFVYNESFHDVTETILSEGACGAGTTWVDLTYNGQLHFMMWSADRMLLKVSQEGYWVGPAASGHYNVLILDNTLGPGETHQYVFSSNGNGTGLAWHVVAHVTIDANGVPRIAFEKVVCR